MHDITNAKKLCKGDICQRWVKPIEQNVQNARKALKGRNLLAMGEAHRIKRAKYSQSPVGA